MQLTFTYTFCVSLLCLASYIKAQDLCGIPSISPDESARNGNGSLKIVGGTIAIPNSWPWQVGLMRGGRFMGCAGSLINDRWIVTAAHCEVPVQGLSLNLGDHNIKTGNDGATKIAAERWITHPNFNFYTLDNDIALIKLRTPVQFSDRIKPVCLPHGRQAIVGTSGFTTGWGRTTADSTGPISALLRQVRITINNSTTCSKNGIPTDTQICAGSINPFRDSCQGDSGGPFVQKDPDFFGQFFLTGVVSYGFAGCGGRGVYARVTAFEQWITTTIANN